MNPQTLKKKLSWFPSWLHLYTIYLESEGVAGDAVLHQTMLGVIEICQLGADADDEYHTI